MGRQIANAQILFNVIGVVLVLPLLPAIARALEKLLPDKDTEPAQIADSLPAE